MRRVRQQDLARVMLQHKGLQFHQATDNHDCRTEPLPRSAWVQASNRTCIQRVGLWHEYSQSMTGCHRAPCPLSTMHTDYLRVRCRLNTIA